jgi:hypothetical protein
MKAYKHLAEVSACGCDVLFVCCQRRNSLGNVDGCKACGEVQSENGTSKQKSKQNFVIDRHLWLSMTQAAAPCVPYIGIARPLVRVSLRNPLHVFVLLTVYRVCVCVCVCVCVVFVCLFSRTGLYVADLQRLEDRSAFFRCSRFADLFHTLFR